MAVAYVSDVENSADPASGTLTLSTVLGSGGNVVIAFTTWRSNTGQTCTGATYGGNAMTRIGTEITSTGASLTSFYYVTSSDGDVVFTYSAAPTNAQGTALVFSGVDTGSPIGTQQTSASAGTATTTSAVTSATDGLCVDCLGLRSDNTGLTIGAGQTQRSAQEAASSVYHRTSTEPGAASVTMSWSWTNSMGFVHMAVPINAAAAGSSITPAAGSLALSGAAPTVSVSGNISITPAAAALAIVGAAVTQTLTVPSPSAGALTFEGAAPTVSQTTGATIQPNAGAITLAGASPTVTNTTPGIVIAPASGSLSLAGSAPTVALNNMDIVPTAGALTLAGAAPNVSVTGSSSGGQARNRRRRGMLNMIWGR